MKLVVLGKLPVGLKNPQRNTVLLMFCARGTRRHFKGSHNIKKKKKTLSAIKVLVLEGNRRGISPLLYKRHASVNAQKRAPIKAIVY